MARRRQEKGPWFWRGAIGAMLASVFGLFAVMAFKEPPPLNPATHCRIDGNDPAHTIMLIDQSDPFSENDINWVKELVDNEARQLRRFGRLTILIPNASSPYDPKVIFSKCSPGSAADANPILSNPRMVEDIWRDTFFSPLYMEVEIALKDTRQETSPLAETLYAAADRPDFQKNIPHRKIVLVSDLIQNSFEFSFYKSAAEYTTFEASMIGSNLPSLEDVDILARIVPRREYDLPIEDVRMFWRRYFEQTGTKSAKVN